MKTNKSLLVKFLTVLCALCLSLSVAFGLVACGEDTVSIVDSAINSEGKLVLTYSDGTTKEFDVIGKNGQDGVDGEDGEDLTACAHTKLELEETIISFKDKANKDKYANVCYVQFAVCMDCGHVVAKNHEHNLGDIAKVEPTCEDAGLENGKECTICGYYTDGTEIPALGHNYDYNEDGVEDAKDYHYVVNENSNICEDGAVSVKTCVVCGHTEVASMQAPQEHVVATWAKTATLPTADNEGLLTGLCSTCGDYVVKKIPALSAEAYEVDETNLPKKCSENGKIVYTLKEEIVDADGNAFVFEVPVSAKAHTVGGALEVANKVYKLADLDAEKLIITETVEQTCDEEVGYGIVYFCDVCNEAIDIKVCNEHTVAENAQGVVTAPNCIEGTNGYTTYKCSVCDADVVKDEVEWAHTIDYTYEKDGDVYKVVEFCKVPGCGHEVKYTANLVDDSNKPTCSKDGSIYFALVEDSEVIFEKTLTLDKLPHKLLVGNVKASVEDRVYEISELGGKDAAQLIITEGKLDQITCSSEISIVAKCADCQTNIDVVVSGDHVYDENDKIPHVATCTTNSYEEIKCTACGFYIAQPENDDATGHELVYGEPVLDGGKYKIAVSCSNTNCLGDFEHEIIAVSTEVLPGDEATCLAEGTLTVWLDAEKTQKKTIKIAKTAHSIYIDGQLTTVENVVYTIGRLENDNNTLIITEGTVPTCDSTVGYPIVAKCKYDGCPAYIDVNVKGDHTGTITNVEQGSTGATCLTKGVQVKHCSECDNNFEEVILATGHTYEFNVTGIPTKDADGVLNVSCHCGLDVDVVLPKFGKLAEAEKEVAYVLEGNQKLVYTISVSENEYKKVSCANDGEYDYTYTLTFKGNKDETNNVFTKTYAYTEVSSGHEPRVPVYTWEHEGKVYTAYLCEHCNKMFVTLVEDAA